MPTAPVSRLAGKAALRGARRAPRELSPPLSEESEEFSNSSSGDEEEEEDIDGETLSDCSEASSGYVSEEEEVGAPAAPAAAAPAAAVQAAEPPPPQTPPPQQQQEPRRRWDSHPDTDGEQQEQQQRGNLRQAASKRSWRRYRYQIVEALFTFNGDRAAAKRYLLFNRGVLVPAAVLKYYYHRHYRKPLWPTTATSQDPGASPSPPRC